MHDKISAADLETILTLTRTGTLAQAGERLGLDSSTVFRNLQRIERALEQRLFGRTRSGYQPTELALVLAEHAEQIETQMESARSVASIAYRNPEHVTGTVRITTTDSLLYGLVLPALQALESQHPHLSYELYSNNAFASLTRRDADIAVRATKHCKRPVISYCQQNSAATCCLHSIQRT